MHDAVLEMPIGLSSTSEAGSLGALLEPLATREKKIPRSASKLIKELVSLLDEQVSLVFDASSVEVFRERRQCVWPRYIRSLRALSEIAKVIFSPAEVESRAKAGFIRLAADLEKSRHSLFSGKTVDQALFTLWGIEQSRSLLEQLSTSDPPKDKHADRDLSIDCLTWSLWAQFHMDSVLTAMKRHKVLPEEIQGELCEGLRAMVNAHVSMKEALALRKRPIVHEVIKNLPWNEEDERLLAFSMRDINAFGDSDCS